MVGYYYTDMDRAFVEELLKEWEDLLSGSLRIAYETEAKRGRHWRLDGEEIAPGDLCEKLHALADEWDYPSVRSKLGNVGTRHAILALLRDEVGKLSGEREGAE